jgi:F0F1-type ATP synthase assembly protein I
MAQTEERGRDAVKTLLIVLVGQVGCITLAVILLSVLVGLWLDRTLNTRPWFTLALLLAGVPISVVLMLQVARRTLDRISREEPPIPDNKV